MTLAKLALGIFVAPFLLLLIVAAVAYVMGMLTALALPPLNWWLERNGAFRSLRGFLDAIPKATPPPPTPRASATWPGFN